MINARLSMQTSRRLKRVAIMAEEFILGLLDRDEQDGKNGNTFMYGWRFEDRFGEFPPGTRVENFTFLFNPSCFQVMLSNPEWPEVDPGEEVPLIQSQLRITKAFINKEYYQEHVAQPLRYESTESSKELARQLINKFHRSGYLDFMPDVTISGASISITPTQVDQGKLLIFRYPKGANREVLADEIRKLTTTNPVVMVPDHSTLDECTLGQLKQLRDSLSERIYNLEQRPMAAPGRRCAPQYGSCALEAGHSGQHSQEGPYKGKPQQPEEDDD